MLSFEILSGKRRYDYPTSRFHHNVKKTVKHIQKLHWRYQNIVYIFASLVVAYIILISGIVNEVGELGNIGYLSSFVFGLLLSYGATAAPAAISLFVLGKQFDPLFVSLLAAVGSTITDILLFHFIKGMWQPHIENVLKFFKVRWQIVLLRIERSKIFQAIIAVTAGFLIASPLPNELAIFFLNAVKYDTKRFILLAYIFHFIGILIIVELGRSF